MRIGTLIIYLELTESYSLKDKRMVIKSLKERLRRKFNISIAEVGDNDKWRRCVLGISAVSRDKKFTNSVFDKIINHVDRERLVLILDTEMEFL